MQVSPGTLLSGWMRYRDLANLSPLQGTSPGGEQFKQRTYVDVPLDCDCPTNIQYPISDYDPIRFASDDALGNVILNSILVMKNMKPKNMVINQSLHIKISRNADELQTQR